jgi:hypothetical protein
MSRVSRYYCSKPDTANGIVVPLRQGAEQAAGAYRD